MWQSKLTQHILGGGYRKYNCGDVEIYCIFGHIDWPDKFVAECLYGFNCGQSNVYCGTGP